MPKSANEYLLMKIAGEQVDPDSPFNREPQSANEYWLKQIAENGGGGGSSLPAYTAADKGKFLGLGDSDPETQEIISEQTVEMITTGEVSDGSATTLLEANEIAALEGETVSVVVSVGGITSTFSVKIGYVSIGEFGYPGVSVDGGLFKVAWRSETPGYATVRYNGTGVTEISLEITRSVPAVEPKWEEASGLPSYTSADIGKVLTVSEDAEHPTLQTLIEEQSATLANNGMAWVAPLTVLNSAYFENAEVGDKCFITLDGGNETESTAIDVYGYTLFPISTFYVGYASMFGGIGIASLSEPSEKTHTVEVKANAPSAVAIWAQGKDVVILPSANEIGTYVTNTLSTRKNSASNLGVPSYADIDASVIASDNDAFDNMFNIFANAVKNDKMIKFDRHFATSYSYAVSGTDVVNVQASFTDPFYNRGSGDKVYNAEYMLRLWYSTGNERHYGIYSCITLISQSQMS